MEYLKINSITVEGVSREAITEKLFVNQHRKGDFSLEQMKRCKNHQYKPSTKFIKKNFNPTTRRRDKIIETRKPSTQPHP